MKAEQNICKFIPAARGGEEICPLNFVLETRCSAATPAVRSVYALHLVTEGKGVFIREGKETNIEKGDIFFTTPTMSYAICEGERLAYAYVSFTGTGAKGLLQRIGGDSPPPVFKRHESLIPLWQEALAASNPKNVDLLARSVLEFSASRLINYTACGNSSPFVAKLKRYIEQNFSDPDLSLKGLAAKFGYNEKYLSRLFFRYMGVRFNDYLTDLRINAACAMMETDSAPVKEIAYACGFADPLYFSKVFKAKMKCTPTEFYKTIRKPL